MRVETKLKSARISACANGPLRTLASGLVRAGQSEARAACSYPCMPVIEMPSMKRRWAKKKTITPGSTTTSDAAIR